MKFRLARIALVVFMFSYFGANAQWNSGTLYFKNGEVKKGEIKFNGTEHIKYRTSKDEKKVKYHFSELEKLDLSKGSINAIYVYLLLEENLFQVVRQLETGKVNLYSLVRTYYGPSTMPGSGGGVMTMGHTNNINHLFVKFIDDELPTHLGSNQLFTKNFKKAVSEFFKDCQVLVQKIENKEYKKKDIQQIVAFYNKECQ